MPPMVIKLGVLRIVRPVSGLRALVCCLQNTSVLLSIADTDRPSTGAVDIRARNNDACFVVTLLRPESKPQTPNINTHNQY